MNDSQHASSGRLIRSPEDAGLDELCAVLKVSASQWRTINDWPSRSLRACADAGVYRWFLSESQGGFGWDAVDQTKGYLRLAQADLTTTFVITQYMGAVRRIAGSENHELRDQWIEPLLSGDQFGTVGISHLTTSGRHLKKPVLSARQTAHGFVLNGMAPWATGAPHSDVVVTGATLEDGRQILAAVPTATPGVTTGPGISLVALSASCTDRVQMNNVNIDSSMLIAGPVENVMQSGTGGSAGGLKTSTLAVGLSAAAVAFLVDEASRREELQPIAQEMASEQQELKELLLRAVGGGLERGDDECSAPEVRGKANRFAMRSTQAALTAAKGAGFVDSHDVGRWCRQALFFLVWSCPQPVAQSHLCELAGIQ